jgi:hypothetical protein
MKDVDPPTGRFILWAMRRATREELDVGADLLDRVAAGVRALEHLANDVEPVAR